MGKPKSKTTPRRRAVSRSKTLPTTVLKAPHGIDRAQWRTLRPRQQKFILVYLATLNGSQAARDAGYAPETANRQAVQNLSKPVIAAVVEQGLQANLSRAHLSRELVIEAMRRNVVGAVDGDVRRFFDERGNHIPIHLLSDADASIVDSFEVILKNAKAGDGVTDEVLKVKVKDQSKWVELAAKHLRMLEDAKPGAGAGTTIERLVVLIQQRPADWESRK